MREPAEDLTLPSVEDIHRWAAWREIAAASEGAVDGERIPSQLTGSAGSVVVEYFYDPTWEQEQEEHPAGRAVPAPAYPEEWTGERLLEHTCHLKHVQLYLPVEVPVPSLRWSPQDGNGDVHDTTRITIHPAFAIAGKEAIRQALQSSAERLRHRAARLLIKAHERESLCDAPMELPDGSRVPTSMEGVRAQTGDGAPFGPS